jgi:hypothetical protein
VLVIIDKSLDTEPPPLPPPPKLTGLYSDLDVVIKLAFENIDLDAFLIILIT